MNAITIRNLSDEVTRALEARAIRNGTTAEVEAERILQDALSAAAVEAVYEDGGSASGEDLVAAFQKLREEYPELDEIEFKRDQTLATGVNFK